MQIDGICSLDFANGVNFHVLQTPSPVSSTNFLLYICGAQAQDGIILMILSDDKKVGCLKRQMAWLQSFKPWRTDLKCLFPDSFSGPSKSLPPPFWLSFELKIPRVDFYHSMWCCHGSVHLRLCIKTLKTRITPEINSNLAWYCFHFPHTIILVTS